ncbi:6-oxocyclohex-1-ene-1-carbonyl-CoA hydratase [Aromatoleum petrolei]|uniref:6-oxocyclohex-1-ene-1-carbonyl-CoA hydratase n=2 Tax=Aromatoleum TaxID=551759 RepID=A0ABX1MJL6_9RHOO|nr:6-oxocyclohex-1-ene-1-carbonyl-CoA hydratase [Aromatoleum petrolei]NMF88147.1 6-oxocyclohex-1-ene-1-carbonyl-CoA hydratase [Aromatoleum petrolei]QTQ38993.1 6-oxocyclohex-1-ene-1-carbonyl-CoA hydrolase [Aromatoleum petrolei]
MALDWLPRDNETKDHALLGHEHFGTEAPSVIFEKRPVTDPQGNQVPGLYAAWIILNNPKQYNSYTTEMVKGVIAGFQRASGDRTVTAVVFTAMGDKAFCTGGNTEEYASYYARRPNEYGEYMDLFNAMVDGILNCKKPVICRVNGMRVGGGQEIGMATDITITSDMAVFGQAGPKHGSAPDGGSTDFLPWMLNMEDAMYNCISCEPWSAYKMKSKNLITKVVPVLKNKDGEWVRNPLVRTDAYVDDGELVYGEPVAADKVQAAKELIGQCTTDFSRLDAEVNALVWKFTNLFPQCLIKSIDGIRGKKKFFWDQLKLANRHWLAANMNHEAYLGFTAFNNKKATGKDVIDFIKFRQLVAEGAMFDDNFAEQVLAKPKA